MELSTKRTGLALTDGTRTGLSAQNRALLEESLADSNALAVPIVHEIC